VVVALAEQDQVGRVEGLTATADRADVMNLETAFARARACLADAIALTHALCDLAPLSRVDHLLVVLAPNPDTLTRPLSRSFAVDTGTATLARNQPAAT
jgi:hypothetical protein